MEHEILEECKRQFDALEGCINGSAEKIDAIYDLFFGSPEKPRNGLIMEVEKNSAFRRFCFWAGGVVIGAILTYGIVDIVFKSPTP